MIDETHVSRNMQTSQQIYSKRLTEYAIQVLNQLANENIHNIPYLPEGVHLLDGELRPEHVLDGHDERLTESDECVPVEAEAVVLAHDLLEFRREAGHPLTREHNASQL